VAALGTVFRDKLSSKSVVIVRGMAAKLEPAKDYKELALSPRQGEEKKKSSSSEQSDTYQRRRPLFIIEFL